MGILRCVWGLLLVSVSAALVPGCTGKDPYAPGEALGTFKVTAKLLSTTCGPTPDPWEFDVKLRHTQSTLYWVQGDAPISGQVDPTARAVMKASDVRTVREADARTKTAACTMSRSDTVDLVLAPLPRPAVDPTGATSFSGSLTYSFAATQGSSCDDQLLDSGGDYAALPCTVAYELAAVRTSTR